MLGRTNAGSGGGGGLGDNDALLRVTAAENATVTIQLGNGVVRNPNFVRQEYNTSKFYSYFIINSNNFGTYTIIATVSGNTKRTTQAINQAKAYFVNLASLILFEKGTPTIASELGEFGHTSYTSTTTIGSSGIILGDNSNYGDAFWFENNIASLLQNYTTLNITIGSNATNQVRIGLSSDKSLDFFNNYQSSLNKINPYFDHDTSTSATTASINIAALDGSKYYLAGMVRIVGGKTTITKIELT